MKKTEVPRPDIGAGLTDSPEYLTKKQLAHRLGVSIRTIDSLMRAKKLSYLKLTRKLVRFRKEDTDHYLARNFRVNAVGQ